MPDRPSAGTPVRLSVMESKHGWAYAVTTGDGSEPGSLKAADFCYPTADDAWHAGRGELKRVIEQRDCEHMWPPAETLLRICQRCGVYRPERRDA